MSFFGVIKESGVDDQGLIEFNNDYYPFPLYRDDNLVFYKALGDRKLGISWNPIKFMKGLFSLRRVGKRLKRKSIKGNLVGEGITKGGVIIFGTDGEQKYGYLEETIPEMAIDDITAAALMLEVEQ